MFTTFNSKSRLLLRLITLLVRIVMVNLELSWVITDYHGLSWVITGSHGLSPVVTGCHSLSRVVTCCHGLSLAVTGYQE